MGLIGNPGFVKNRKGDAGFTIVELLVALAISMIVLVLIFMTFKSQHDSYIVQTQVAVTLQNARAAMHILTRDIQMVGFYSNFDGASYTMDWDNMDWEGNTSDDTTRSLILAKNNNAAGSNDGVMDGTDLIVIVKASQNPNDGRAFAVGETASGTTASSSLRDAGTLTTGMWVLFVKADLTRSEFVRVTDNAGVIGLSKTLVENYGEGDLIFRADYIIYYVSDTADLMGQNLGNAEDEAQIVAEGIDNLQFRYVLDDGTTVDSGFTGSRVRAVEISLLARTQEPIRGYTDPNVYNIGGVDITPGGAFRRKVLRATIKTRNIGL